MFSNTIDGFDSACAAHVALEHACPAKPANAAMNRTTAFAKYWQGIRIMFRAPLEAEVCSVVLAWANQAPEQRLRRAYLWVRLVGDAERASGSRQAVVAGGLTLECARGAKTGSGPRARRPLGGAHRPAV